MEKSNKVAVLVIGDGNFSFSRRLCESVNPSNKKMKNDSSCTERRRTVLESVLLLSPEKEWNVHISCSSYENEQNLLSLYPEAKDILRDLRRFRNTSVHFEVDATSLGSSIIPPSETHFVTDNRQTERTPSEKGFPLNDCDRQKLEDNEKDCPTALSPVAVPFSRVIWNNPHCGIEDSNLNHSLLSHFIHSLNSERGKNKIFTEDVLVLLSLVSGQPCRWRLSVAAERQRWVVFHKFVSSDLAREKNDNQDESVISSLVGQWDERRGETGSSFRNSKMRRVCNNTNFVEYFVLCSQDILKDMPEKNGKYFLKIFGDTEEKKQEKEFNQNLCSEEFLSTSNSPAPTAVKINGTSFCSVCELSFDSTATDEKSHLNHFLSNRRSKCPICQKLCRDNRSLQQHSSAVHLCSQTSADKKED